MGEPLPSKNLGLSTFNKELNWAFSTFVLVSSLGFT